MKDFNWKIFAGEMVVYAVLVFAYFWFVLHYFAASLEDMFHHNRELFAFTCLALMIGQAVGLEIVSSFLFKLFSWKKK